jgi:Ca2+-binding RTX toxin-like protein
MPKLAITWLVGAHGLIPYTIWGYNPHGSTTREDADLCVMRPDGCRQRRLTRGPGFDVGAAWSTDGKRLAFARASRWEIPRFAPSSIHVVDVAIARTSKLPTGSINPLYPAWSPDGRRLSFQDRAGYRDSSIYVMAADGTGIRRIAAGSALDWSPDGTKVAYTGQSGVTVANPDGTDATAVAWGRSPAWSPDGEKIAYLTGHAGNVFVVDRDGSSLRQLMRDNAGLLSPIWAPDGRSIASVRTGLPGRDVTMGDLWIMNPDGGAKRRLTNYVRWSPEQSFRGLSDPAWQPGEPEADLGLNQSCAPSLLGSRRGDAIRGTAGHDAIYGLAGSDTIRGNDGHDYLSGGPGADRLVTRDSVADELACGWGRDTAIADRHDLVGRDCEQVTRR